MEQLVGIERHGVSAMPEHRRTARPVTVMWVLVGSNLSLSATVFGWLPVTYGLSWWQIVVAATAGTALGLMLAAPLALLGFRAGTSNTVAAGAHFGVRGRLVGSLIGLLLSLGYTAVAIWTGGEAVVVVLARVSGTAPGEAAHGLAYAGIAVLVAALAVCGFELISRISAVLVAPMALVLGAGVVAYAPGFDPSWSAPTELNGASAWILALVTAGISGPVAYATIIGDYTRYLSPRRHSAAGVVWSSAAGLFCGLLAPTLFGAFVAISTRAEGAYLESVARAAPAWYLPLLLFAGVAGCLGAAGVPLYNMGLELHGLFPRTSRTAGAAAATAITLGLVFLGRFTVGVEEAVTGFVVVLTVVATPWAVIALIGHVRCGRVYDVRDLQVHNKSLSGGRYWYAGGWNPRACAAWLAGTAVGLLDADSPLYTGPLVALTGGLDVGYLLSALVSACVYLLLGTGHVTGEPIPDWRQTYLWPAATR
ncbi:purine-cytosine permease family protein [Nonomuraea sp. NPDC050451]|uniref:purine-cytosine permease family protein n=1 Tax=Nonomuraea sp. NPDC050451 TaxID=3364364 RepID=UPI0037AEA927